MAKWADYTSEWLNFAVERNVEHVVLLSYSTRINIRGSFCTFSSLITFDITYCQFDFCKAILWKSLKSIKMDEMILSNYFFVKLLAGCPVLETMELSGVICVSRMEINSLKLKRLYLINLYLDDSAFGYETSVSIEIFAPYLQHFRISGNLEDIDLKLLDVSSLVSASLTFINCCANRTCGLSYDDEESRENYHKIFGTAVQDNLQKLSCVTELTLGSYFTEVLCMLQLKGVPIPELKCKYLTLELHIEEFNLCGGAGILRALPHMETLSIDMFKNRVRSRCNFESRYLAEGENIDMQSWISSFEFPNLKSVNIVYSSEVCLKNHSNQGLDKLFKLSEFVLKNATILEKFVISKRIKCRQCSINCVSPYLSQLAEKLLGCPRASTNCMIIFQE